MPIFIVQHTPIIHGDKNAKKPEDAVRYEVGDEINISEVEARKLGGNVQLKSPDAKKDK